MPINCKEVLKSVNLEIQKKRVPKSEVPGIKEQLSTCLRDGGITQAEYDATITALNALGSQAGSHVREDVILDEGTLHKLEGEFLQALRAYLDAMVQRYLPPPTH